MATTNSKNNNILDVLQDEVIAHVFSFLSAANTAKCSEVCRQFHSVATNSRCLWRQYVADDFRFKEGNDQADWRQVYAYMAQRLKDWKANYASGDSRVWEPLNARVVFSDDGSPVPGYPPDFALQRGGPLTAWCTNAGVEEDVDLVVKLPGLCFVTHVEAANGPSFFSAPVKEMLVFSSTKPIDLESARKYNGKEGTKWAKKFHLAQNVNADPITGNEPLFGIQFPPLPHAFGAHMNHALNHPVVAHYMHFKLLSSYKPPGMLADNIDVQNLFTFGPVLSNLPQLVQQPSLNQHAKDPSYQRMHAIREYPY